VSKDRIRQDHYLVVISCSVIMVRSTGEGIGMVVSTRYVLKLIIEIFQKVNVSCNPPINLLGMVIVL